MKNLNYFILIFLSFLLIACTGETNVEASIDGNYNCEETVLATASSSAIKTNFEIRIIPLSADNKKYKIENFYNIGYSNNIQVNLSDDIIEIPTQNSGGFEISGSGIVANRRIDFTYTAKDAAGKVDNCTAIANRK